jgi:hypothetical protein
MPQAGQVPHSGNVGYVEDTAKSDRLVMFPNIVVRFDPSHVFILFYLEQLILNADLFDFVFVLEKT